MQESLPQKIEEQPKEKTLFQKVKEMVSDEAYVEADIPFLEELELTKDEVKWISEVKKESTKKYSGEGTQGEPWLFELVAKRHEESLSVYELVKLHLLLQRDLKKFGSTLISERTEQKIDEFAMDLFAKIREYNNSRQWDKYFCSTTEGIIKKYSQAKNAQEKMRRVSELLNIIHQGGRNIVLEGFFKGVPEEKYQPRAEASRDFLYRLNNLGKLKK